VKKVKTSELIGAALDRAVAKAMGRRANDFGWWWDNFKPSIDPSQAYPIIDREDISVIRCEDNHQKFPDKWFAQRGANSYCESTEYQQHEAMLQFSIANNGGSFAKDGPFYGPTPLIAAMRCYVASNLGNEVELV
jgi:hypothetical protein